MFHEFGKQLFDGHIVLYLANVIALDNSLFLHTVSALHDYPNASGLQGIKSRDDSPLKNSRL
jgi:hypothetical protein